MESLECRIALVAGIHHDLGSRVLSIVGSAENDVADVRQQGADLVVSLTSVAGRVSRTVPAEQVSQVVFKGLAGNDTFTNQTAIPSWGNGGAGADILRGGLGADVLLGGGGNDQLAGDAGSDVINGGAGEDAVWGGLGNDRLMGGVGRDQLYGEDGDDDMWGGTGDDMLDGSAGNDVVRGEDGSDMLLGGIGNDLIAGGGGNDELQGGSGDDSLQAGDGNDMLNGDVGRDLLVGGAGLAREVDQQDRFAEGVDDGDGFDHDYESLDILYELPGSASAYADDATVAPIIASVSADVRSLLQISSDDDGLRVRVARDRSGTLVTGTWRYLTPDRIQVWGRWAYPESDPAQLNAFVRYSYTGPYSGNVADYTDPANYVISEESRVYANTADGPLTFVSWVAGRPANFYFTSLNPRAVEALREAFGSMPSFTNTGNSFSGDFSTAPGLPGVRPVVDLLRTERQLSRTLSTRPRALPAPLV
ncbi:MAG: calcium-binding protein [Planctomycetia bacterium]